MQAVATNVAWSVHGPLVSPVETPELIEVPFGMWTQVGPGNHALDHDGGLDAPRGRGSFGGDTACYYHYSSHLLCPARADQ